MKPILLVIFLVFSSQLFSQKPANGTYTYTIAFAEWNGQLLGATCTVKIQNDSIWIIHNGSKKLDGTKGEVIDSGVIAKHKSGKWIIAHFPKDKIAKKVGGCSDGPRVIDFKQKKFWLC